MYNIFCHFFFIIFCVQFFRFNNFIFRGTKPIPATPEELAALTGAEATEDDGIEMIGEDEDDETDQIEEPIEKEVKVCL